MDVGEKTGIWLFEVDVRNFAQSDPLSRLAQTAHVVGQPAEPKHEAPRGRDNRDK
jgi:hypothetical protein